MKKLIILIVIIIIVVAGYIFWYQPRKMTMLSLCREVCVKEAGIDYIKEFLGNPKSLDKTSKDVSDFCLLKCLEKYGLTPEEFDKLQNKINQ